MLNITFGTDNIYWNDEKNTFFTMKILFVKCSVIPDLHYIGLDQTNVNVAN